MGRARELGAGVGGSGCQELRHVTPASLVAIFPLLEARCTSIYQFPCSCLRQASAGSTCSIVVLRGAFVDAFGMLGAAARRSFEWCSVPSEVPECHQELIPAHGPSASKPWGEEP